jgi:surface-anchored protein
MKHITALTLPLALAISQPVFAASQLTGGHIDGPAFGYDTADGFEPHFHNEGGPDGAIIDGVRQETESEFEPADLIVVVGLTSTTTLGATSYYWLPETETAAATNNVPFLGIGLEELNLADWSDGIVTLTLLNHVGPGKFRLWQDDGFGGAIDFIHTDGGAMSFNIAAGTHTHYNWGFTELGIHELEFQISGTHVVDQFQSGAATYTFAVPEPSTALLGALGAVALLRRRR